MKGNKIVATLVVLAMLFSTMMVLNKIDVNFVEKAGAQPGVDEWGNATTDLVYDTTYADGAVKINTSKWTYAGTYYLYYPIYTSTGAGPNANSFTWGGPYKVGVASVNVVATQGNSDSIDTGGSSISFNRSGMWIFDNASTSHWGNDTSTYAGYIWVNTSTDYVISDVADFKYNSSGSKTITVDTGDDTGCMISIVAPDNTTTYHKWRATGVSAAIGIKGNFSMVGDYTVRAYRDFDEDTSVYLYGDGDSGWEAYDNTYGSNMSFPAAPSNSTDYYNYTLMGPWDPPEKNATEVTFTVDTGEPNIALTNDTAIYWGFALKMEVNVTDDDGDGIAGGTVRLRKGDTWITNASHVGIWIKEDGKGNYTINVTRYAAGSTTDWVNLVNGTWRVVFSYDIDGDGTDEWNNSKKISIKSTSPPVRINIDNDGWATSTDKKVDVPTTSPGLAGPAETINITFTIMGRSISDDEGRAYYGDDTGEDYKNITISGDILYPIHHHSGNTLSGTLINQGDGTWGARVTPTKPGGTITIAIDWPGSNNGSASETIEIINGTQVTTSVEAFTVGEHINLTVRVKDTDGDPVKTAFVTLFWAGHSTTPGAINSTNGTNKAGNGQNGEYTFWIQPGDQGSTAPENITVAAKWKGAGFWGYAKVVMEKNHNMIVNCTPTTAYAGDTVEYDIDVSLVEGGNPEKTGLTVAIYNETGVLVTGDDAWSKTSAYDIDDAELTLSAGTYYIHAYNNTHDSQGQNATIIVTAYTVVSTPSVLAWLIDTDTNMTFEVTPVGNGTLTIHNMSSTPNASHLGEAETVDIENGVGTLDDVNATTLGNLTFTYQPEDGEDRTATGLVRVTTATAIPNPSIVYIGEPTIVEITITHPATGLPLQGVRIGLDTNVALNESLDTLLTKIPDDGFTDENGKVWFSIETGGSGDVTIYVENETDPDNPFVIKSAARKPMTISTDASVNEGGTFTVTAKSRGVLITDATVTIVFAGETYTTTDGTVEATAPYVTTTLDYTIAATAEGYADDDATIKVINIPQLLLVIPDEVQATTTFEVAVADDTGGAIVGAAITFDGKTYTTGVNGIAKLTAPDDEGSYPIEAAFGNYVTATDIVTVTAAPGIPGFELLTLIAAIGVAFILFRRRRN